YMESKKKTAEKAETGLSGVLQKIVRILKGSLDWVKGKVTFKFLKKRKFWQYVLISFLFLTLVGLGVGIGVYKALLQNLPPITQLEDYEPYSISYIYADDGQVAGEFAKEKRVRVSFDEIPDVLKQAIIATEDPRFYKHNGIDFRGILRAVWVNLKNLGKIRPHGGSTITQQLMRRLLLTYNVTIRRKLKEMILALRIEKMYSKEKILALYCNQFHLGHGAYGVETAAQRFFGKSVRDINLVEAALLAGIFRNANQYSPYNNPVRTLERRNHVLTRMEAEGYITKDEYESAKLEPMEVLPLARYQSDFAAYFLEEVRKHVVSKYGADALFQKGLRIYTTLNFEKQRYAEAALRRQLRLLDREQGWRMDKINLLEMGVEDLKGELRRFEDPLTEDYMRLDTWRKIDIEKDDIIEAVVLSVTNSQAEVRVKDLTGVLTNKNIAWTKSRNLNTLIKQGDLIHIKIDSIDVENKKLEASLEQEPELEGATMAIVPQTGAIQTMVGGYSFKRLKFNQTTQAMRQSGSVIKPFLYTAALDNGYSPTSIFVDEKTDFHDKWTGLIYDPPNYDLKYKGAVTLRHGIEESRNIVSVKLLDAIGPEVGVDYVKRFGVTAPIYPYLSLALGAFEVKMIELVSAFSTFPNKGVRMTPYLIERIEDKDGNILEEHLPESYEVISPQLAYIVTSLLRGVVQRGTAWPAGRLEKNLCGKTGTTDEHSDAWFMGFSPILASGVWIGHKEGRRTIGPRKSGMVAALPIFVDFFEQIIAEEKKQATEAGGVYTPEVFEEPPHLEYLSIDRRTGKLSNPFICLSDYIIQELFLPNMTKPSRYCTHEDHLLTLDYYMFLNRDDN
ncbi:penicillin-binding protein 1A, partial [Acidobacteriota bacterium]